MAQIGVKRFAASDDEHDGAQHQKARRAVVMQEARGVDRIDRSHHVRLLERAPDAEAEQRAEPQHHDRPEDGAEARRAAALHGRTNRSGSRS